MSMCVQFFLRGGKSNGRPPLIAWDPKKDVCVCSTKTRLLQMIVFQIRVFAMKWKIDTPSRRKDTTPSSNHFSVGATGVEML